MIESVVALLAEGVDRNPSNLMSARAAAGSPSSRRAWIEIAKNGPPGACSQSPSSRRAWIEISRSLAHVHSAQCRPPRGGRG